MWKSWILYVVIAWSNGPLLSEEQKTVLLQFDHKDECISIAQQVDKQTQDERAPFKFKHLACYSCEDFFADRAKVMCLPKRKTPK